MNARRVLLGSNRLRAFIRRPILGFALLAALGSYSVTTYSYISYPYFLNNQSYCPCTNPVDCYNYYYNYGVCSYYNNDNTTNLLTTIALIVGETVLQGELWDNQGYYYNSPYNFSSYYPVYQVYQPIYYNTQYTPYNNYRYHQWWQHPNNWNNWSTGHPPMGTLQQQTPPVHSVKLEERHPGNTPPPMHSSHLMQTPMHLGPPLYEGNKNTPTMMHPGHLLQTPIYVGPPVNMGRSMHQAMPMPHMNPMVNMPHGNPTVNMSHGNGKHPPF